MGGKQYGHNDISPTKLNSIHHKVVINTNRVERIDSMDYRLHLPIALHSPATAPEKLVDGGEVNRFSWVAFPVNRANKRFLITDGGEVNRFSWVAFPVNRANKRFLITHKSRGS